MARTKQTSRLDDGNSTSKRIRASKACMRCNQKRVKCDVMEVGTPCSRCHRNGLTECELIATRRGRYSREAVKSRRSLIEKGRTNEVTASATEDRSGSQEFPDADRATTPASDLDLTRGAEGGPRSDTVEGHVSPDGSSTAARPSYREVSWSAMFNHLLDSRSSNNRDVVDKCSITYLGESFPLALVLEDLQDEGRLRLHHAGPPLEGAGTPESSSNHRTLPAHLLPEDINCLESKKAFDKPRAEVLDVLISTFLDVFFPLYPIVHREEFQEQHRHDNLPWILLHSCCFVAATFCPISVIHRAGFTGRKQARFSFYRKAKALFDTGYEVNKVVLLQSVIMLTFWGGGPNAYWNFYSWIGTGVTIAETLGIHRSMAATNMEPKDRSLLKRLWWILVVRDAFCATLVGRPLRINMIHGDAEMLKLEDFEHDARNLQLSAHPLSQTFALYQIQVSKLSLVLHDIIFTRFVPGPNRWSSQSLKGKIQNWRQEVPLELNWDLPGHNLLAMCLSILYDHHLILAYLGSTNPKICPRDSVNIDQTPEMAAQRISALSSSVVIKSQSLSIPHETFQGIFLAGVVSYTQMRSSQPMIAQLGRTTLNNCAMVMHEVDNAWDPAPWVSGLFDKLSMNVPRHLNGNDHNHEIGNAGQSLHSESFDAFEEQTFDYGLCSPWQSNPMLTALFEWPPYTGSSEDQINAFSVLT